MTLLRQLWKDHPVATAGFAAGVLLTLFFLGRIAVFSLYWSDPEHRRMQPEGWMTPGYVAHSWHLPVEDVARELGLELPPPGRPPTLSELARLRGESEEVLLKRLSAWLAVAAARRDAGPGEAPAAGTVSE